MRLLLLPFVLLAAPPTPGWAIPVQISCIGTLGASSEVVQVFVVHGKDTNLVFARYLVKPNAWRPKIVLPERPHWRLVEKYKIDPAKLQNNGIAGRVELDLVATQTEFFSIGGEKSRHAKVVANLTAPPANVEMPNSEIVFRSLDGKREVEKKSYQFTCWKSN